VSFPVDPAPRVGVATDQDHNEVASNDAVADLATNLRAGFYLAGVDGRAANDGSVVAFELLSGMGISTVVVADKDRRQAGCIRLCTYRPSSVAIEYRGG